MDAALPDLPPGTPGTRLAAQPRVGGDRRPRPGPAARYVESVERACRRLEADDVVPDLRGLAAQAGMSAHHFHRVFKATVGLTPKAYATAHRSQRLRCALDDAGTITEAAYRAGFGSSSRFYEASDAVLGMRPSTWRDGGRGTEIRFAVGQCSLGAIAVAQSERGVCAILLGDDPDALVRDLQDRFPHANLVGGDADFERTVAQVIGFIEAPRLGLELPLDVRGTAFQQRVWQALRAIPPGETLSYAQIAERIGAPRAVRAVGQACAANRIAVAIPCHRVVRHDGELSGYRWGVERKRALLERENALR
ncbi:MAG: bifunctional DNA-binding transcriptional regulator/O6-methylguanine-DNA methyltransferase Ada [Burkholderiaceae bacterium]|nr:bifunctional DNA-binding transcriptional regulator/O6-methylguanine-DNA methyltransferase Ada [Burkholderiaceae bacterium]